MSLEVIFVAAILTLIIGTVSTYRLTGRFFAQSSINRNNAFASLQNGSVEDWNSLRILDKAWRPRLASLDFTGVNLQGVNLEGSIIEHCTFRSAQLDQADFSNSVISHVDFSLASLQGALFTNATLTETNFDRADLTDALFDNHVSAEGGEVTPAIETPHSDASEVGERTSSEFLESLGGEEFDLLVADLLRRMGYKIGSSKGGGYKASIFAFKETSLGRETVVVEVKNFRSSVSIIPTSAVRALFGRKELTSASKGFFFTNGLFSESAHRLARKLDGIELFDRFKIAELLN